MNKIKTLFDRNWKIIKLFIPNGFFFSFLHFCPLRCRTADCSATYEHKNVKEEDFKVDFQQQQQLQQQRQQPHDNESLKVDDRPMPYLKRRPNFYEEFSMWPRTPYVFTTNKKKNFDVKIKT